MLYKGVLISQASGRLGDSVWSHNRGGPYVRALGNPNPNPPTPAQENARAAYANVIAYWQALTEGQRQGWRTLSTNSPLTNRLGDRRPCGGLGMFTRANFQRAYQNISPGTATLPIASDAPDLATRPVPPSMLVDATAALTKTKVTVTLDGTSPLWVTGAGMLVYVGNRLAAARRYYRTPMLLAAFLGADTDASTFFPNRDGVTFGDGDHVWLKLQWTYADGAISQPRWIDVPAA